MRNVKLIRLTTGEELICEFVGKKTTEYGYECITVKRPYAIMPNPQVGGIGVFPWCVSTFKATDNDLFEISIASVVMISEPQPEMANSYIEQTSGIAMPESSNGKLLLG